MKRGLSIIAIIIIPANELPKVIKFTAKQYKKLTDFYYKVIRELNIMDIK